MQALTIRHDVHGCSQSVFALGQLYVLRSRVTNPKLFKAVGIPPADLLDEVAAAWSAAGHGVDACFDDAAEVSGHWLYKHAPAGTDPCSNARSKLSQVREEEARVKLQLFTV